MDIDLIKSVPIFASLKADNLERITPFFSLHTYPKDRLIFMEKDIGNSLFIIKSGSVKVTRISEDGREVILAILGVGDFLGEMSLLDGMTRSANVTTLEETDMFMLKREDFLSLIERYPQISISLLKELAKRIRKSDSQIKSLSLLDATGRVASTIIQLAEAQSGSKTGQVQIPQCPSQQDLANMSGTSRETISRTLKQFEEKGLITKKGSTITILDLRSFRKKYTEA